MGMLNNVCRASEAYSKYVEAEVKRARADTKVGRKFLSQWRRLQAQIPTSATPTGMRLPRLALPQIDDPGEIARYLLGQGLPGEFPFVNSAYREMYLAPLHSQNGNSNGKLAEEPTRLFAGLGVAGDTNARFHYLTKHQHSV